MSLVTALYTRANLCLWPMGNRPGYAQTNLAAGANARRERTAGHPTEQNKRQHTAVSAA